jgi:hypothetical protein
MSSWEVWTWISIVILTVGSAAVFFWFLADIVRIRRQILEEERVSSLETGHEGGDARSD